MKLFIVSVAMSFALVSSSFAAMSIECGEPKNAKPGETVYELKSVEYAFSSEDDVFSGPIGDEWVMYIGNKVVSDKDRKVSAKVSKDDEGKVLNVSIVLKTTRVGHRYEVKYLYTDNPTLRIYNIGGFAGGMKTKEMICVGSYD